MSFVVRCVGEKKRFLEAPVNSFAWSSDGICPKHLFATSWLARAALATRLCGWHEWEIFEVTYGVKWGGPADIDEDDEDKVYFVGTDGTEKNPEYFWSEERKEAKRYSTKVKAKAAIHKNHRGFARVVRFLRKVST